MSRETSLAKSDSEFSERQAPPQIAYVRRLWPNEKAPPGVKPTDLYALHSADGERLAVFTDRDMAFAVARRNNFTPVNAH